MAKRIELSTPNSSPLDRIMDDQGRQSQWLARRMGVSDSLVRYWRTGARRITEQHIARVADALGVSVEELSGD